MHHVSNQGSPLLRGEEDTLKRSLGVFALLAAVLTSSVAYSKETTKKETIARRDSTANTIQDTSTHARPNELSLMAYVPWYYGIGIGVTGRYSIVILPDGFIPNINDSFAIEPGMAFEHASWGNFGLNYSYNSIAPYVMGTWSFHFSEAFRAYGGLALGFRIFFGRDAGFVDPSIVTIDPVGGIFYKFSPHVSFRGELGYLGPKAGIAIAL
jgi:hypothetical protein